MASADEERRAELARLLERLRRRPWHAGVYIPEREAALVQKVIEDLLERKGEPRGTGSTSG